MSDLKDIITRMRQYAPNLRGTGPYASDASYNRTLRDADTLEKIEQELIRLRVIAKMADRILNKDVPRETLELLEEVGRKLDAADVPKANRRAFLEDGWWVSDENGNWTKEDQ